MGQPGRWYGVFNNSASGLDAQARVSLDWLDGTRRFKAQRSFRRSNSSVGFIEELTVTVDAVKLPIADAEAVVSALAPGEVVPFFFFDGRSEEHTSELQSLMRISYAVFCLKKQKNQYKS